MKRGVGKANPCHQATGERRGTRSPPRGTGWAPLTLLVLAALGASGCYVMRPSRGGGEARFQPPRTLSTADVAVPIGYRIEIVARDLDFPTGIAFDGQGRPHVVESGYAYGEVFAVPRLLRVEADGRAVEIARGESSGPWTGVAFHEGAFLVAEGGVLEGGRILSITPEGAVRALVRDLPGFGDHHVNGPVVGPDGRVYFGIGTATNSGVVGTDSAAFGWLERHPDFHDIPGADVRLTGVNFRTEDPRGEGGTAAVTGAFLPFGTPSEPGQLVEGRVPCTGAVLSVPAGGGALELVAWGLRNPFGLCFSPGGTLYVTDNGFDERGSRPVWGAPDVLWAVEPGRWYGWPDHAAGQPLDEGDGFAPPGEDAPQRLLQDPPGEPPDPVAVFACHASADGLDICRNAAFGHEGQAFVALFGDQVPATGKLLAPTGFKVVRVDLAGGRVEDFAVNRGRATGPASWLEHGGLERPVAVRFDPTGEALYVVDFGVLLQDGPQARPQLGTGCLWRIVRELPQGGTLASSGAPP